MYSTKLYLVIIALLAASALPSQVAAQHTQYKLIDLGTFGGTQSYVALTDNKTVYTRVLNDRGTVAGTAETSMADPNPFCFSTSNFFNIADCLIAHAFEWHDGTKTDLGVLPGNANSGFPVISASGLIAGVSEDPYTIDPVLGFPEFHAVLWKNGEITELGALTEEGGHSSVADAVNSRGQVVGGAFTGNPDPASMLGTGFQTRAFLWQNGIMQDLGTLGGPDAQALMINEKGQVVGDSYTSNSPNNGCGGELTLTFGAFIWENGKMTDLGNFGGTCTFAFALNNRGQVTGLSGLSGDQAQHAFLWERNTMKDLGTFGGSFSAGNALNDAGEVAGYATLPGDQAVHAAVWNEAGITDVGELPGDANSFGFGINEGGQVLGVSIDSQFTNFRAFVGQKGRPMLDLEPLAARSGLQFGLGIFAKSGTANINNRGEIAGNAIDANGNWHAVLLVPCDQADTDCQDVRATGIEVNPANTPQNMAIANEAHHTLTSGGIPAMMRARMAHSRRNLFR